MGSHPPVGYLSENIHILIMKNRFYRKFSIGKVNENLSFCVPHKNKTTLSLCGRDTTDHIFTTYFGIDVLKRLRIQV